MCVAERTHRSALTVRLGGTRGGLTATETWPDGRTARVSVVASKGVVRACARVCVSASVLQTVVVGAALVRLDESWAVRAALLTVVFLTLVQAATVVRRSLRRWSRHSAAAAGSAAAASVGLLIASLVLISLGLVAPVEVALAVALAGLSWLLVIAWRPQARVLVMGDPDFVGRVSQAARRAGRAMVRQREGIDVIHSAVVSTRDEIDLVFDELVVDGDELSTVQHVPRDLRRDVERVFLVKGRAAGLETTRLGSSSVFGSPVPLGGRLLKRCIDLLVSSLALILFAPVVVAAIIAVRLDGAGPTVLRRPSVGLDGCPFDVLKLRTMRRGERTADERIHTLAKGFRRRGGVSFGVARYPHDTRVGRVLRRLSVDELPQFLNVLLGEMSIVGPRPLHLCELETLTPQTWLRLRVKPGMTGLWQVSGRSRLSESAMFDLDARYVQRWSFLLELLILVRTPLAVFSCRGAA